MKFIILQLKFKSEVFSFLKNVTDQLLNYVSYCHVHASATTKPNSNS